MKAVGFESRGRSRQGLAAGPLDVLVVGGGIVGAGVARDAAMRGLRVGLVEQHDFAFGTSSRSSRLLHGGLRYLAQGRLGLVHEASIEKKILHHIAPHLADPLPFLFPAYRGNQHWVLWQLKIGVKLYDLLCGGRNLGRSTWLNRAEVLERVPALMQHDLQGAVRYYDGFTNDARLVLDTLRSAARAGATALNYCRFKDAAHMGGGQPFPLPRGGGEGQGEGERAERIEHPTSNEPLTPALSPSEGEREKRSQPPYGSATDDGSEAKGATANSQHRFPLPCRGGEGQGEGQVFFQSATEPLWECEIEDQLDQEVFSIRARTIVNATGPWAEGLPHSQIKLRLTKGIHLVVERARIPVPDSVVMTEGKRILFAIPWGERTILGTTDTDYNGSLDHVTADVKDIRYVLQIANQFFPAARLAEADVIGTWAGLRPLIADLQGNPSDISRSHQIRSPEPGWWDVAGGKLTTYRLMAEQTLDQIVAWLRRAHDLNGLVKPCRTDREPLLPVAETASVSGILPPEFSRRAVEHYVANEWAIHLDDVMVRRTNWHYYHRDAAQKAARVADWMGELLGWSGAERAQELQRCAESVCCLPDSAAPSSPPDQRRDDQTPSVV